MVVEPLQAEIEGVGLSTAELSAAVRAQLRAAGIVVYDSQRANPAAAKPYVYVHVSVVGAEDGRVQAIALQVHLRQTLASIVTESRVVDAMSWDAHEVVLAPTATFRAGIAAEVKLLVARFIDDWRAVH